MALDIVLQDCRIEANDNMKHEKHFEHMACIDFKLMMKKIRIRGLKEDLKMRVALQWNSNPKKFWSSELFANVENCNFKVLYRPTHRKFFPYIFKKIKPAHFSH